MASVGLAEVSVTASSDLSGNNCTEMKFPIMDGMAVRFGDGTRRYADFLFECLKLA
jgi:hypothetical protein